MEFCLEAEMGAFQRAVSFSGGNREREYWPALTQKEKGRRSACGGPVGSHWLRRAERQRAEVNRDTWGLGNRDHQVNAQRSALGGLQHCSRGWDMARRPLRSWLADQSFSDKEVWMGGCLGIQLRDRTAPWVVAMDLRLEGRINTTSCLTGEIHG